MAPLNRHFAAYCAALVVAAGWPLLAPAPAEPASAAADTDALRWIPPGERIEPRPLTALEQSFARQFPGRIDRYVDAGGGVWIVRAMTRPTRRLHPAADCFRGLGYTVAAPRVHVDAAGERWSCFAARRDGRERRVCERLFDGGDGRWTDVSSWYWSSLLRPAGPWWAVTRVGAP